MIFLPLIQFLVELLSQPEANIRRQVLPEHHDQMRGPLGYKVVEELPEVGVGIVSIVELLTTADGDEVLGP